MATLRLNADESSVKISGYTSKTSYSYSVTDRAPFTETISQSGTVEYVRTIY